jgi:hypothetical protein
MVILAIGERIVRAIKIDAPGTSSKPFREAQ